ncbi:NYN domain-containing protein, partial [Escherichia coli]|nr:NYN domain-containing protein [Escherichia coli]EEV8494974.1 NYN domain-containing protein [Escherichia coli]EEW1312751.1 NYN domain-containing protein [Escherichia coli]EEW1323150.1 NYN domain-containing protein [Escherichia coli]EEW2906643.1 NYN domain-containing protein [Escherichia coli]
TNCIYFKINRCNSLNNAILISRSPPKPHNPAKNKSI